MIVPIPIHHEPSRCPGCDRHENTKTICRHCGYEYSGRSEWREAAWIAGFVLGALIFAWWALPTGFCFLDPQRGSRNLSFEDDPCAVAGRVTLAACVQRRACQAGEIAGRLW